MTFVAFWSTYIEISGVQQGQSKTRTFTRNPLPVKPELLPIPTTVVLYKGKAGIRAIKVSAHWLPTSTTSPSETGREHAAIDTRTRYQPPVMMPDTCTILGVAPFTAARRSVSVSTLQERRSIGVKLTMLTTYVVVVPPVPPVVPPFRVAYPTN